MGRFSLAALLQLALCPFFLALPLIGAALAGTRGFLYASSLGYTVAAALRWTVLRRVGAATSTAPPDPAVV